MKLGKVFLCQNQTGTTTITQFCSGEKDTFQIYGTASFNVTLSVCLFDNEQYAPILTATISELYTFNTIADAKYKLTITSNGGQLTAVLA